MGNRLLMHSIKLPSNLQIINRPTTMDNTYRLVICKSCSWNVMDKCEHPAQGCRPCRQRRGLAEALKIPTFSCPLNKFNI